MKTRRWIGAFLLTLIACGRGIGGEASCCDPAPQGILQRFRPVGGWSPYGGGLLHWWPKHCFPCCGGPDDYCRKPLPKVCWPPYPSYYIWGLPQTFDPACASPQHCNVPH